MPGSLGVEEGHELEVTARLAPAATMVVCGEGGEVYLLRHTLGEGATARE